MELHVKKLSAATVYAFSLAIYNERLNVTVNIIIGGLFAKALTGHYNIIDRKSDFSQVLSFGPSYIYLSPRYTAAIRARERI